MDTEKQDVKRKEENGEWSGCDKLEELRCEYPHCSCVAMADGRSEERDGRRETGSNPLDKYPHLFANGKFKARTRGGYNCQITAYYIAQNLVGIESGNVKTNDSPKYLTLIARPIEDMTDEEVMGYLDSYKAGTGREFREFGFDVNELRDQIFNACRVDTMSRDQTLYLLSIGVYPFEQDHFEEGTVIKSTEI